MKRRTFLQQTAAVSASLVASNLVFGNKNDEILGHGPKRYRLDTGWGSLDPKRYPVKDCHEMVQDSRGRILLLTNETKNNVLVYDKKGKLINAWGTEYPGAHGLTIFDENGTDVLFICDNNRHQVIKTSIDGKVLMTINYPKESGQYEKAEEFIPTETAIAPNGEIYVADGYGKDYITRYSPNGKYLGQFGGRGEGDQFLKNAHGICVDTRDKNSPVLIVTSREQNAFKRYTLNGDYIDTIPLPGAWVCRPVIKGDYLYAAVLQSSSALWKESGFITILDKNNQVISNPGGTAPAYREGRLNEMKQNSSFFKYPHDVCIDDEDNLYEAQWNSGQVYPFKLKLVI